MRRFLVILLSMVLLTTVSVRGIRDDQDNGTSIGYLVIDPGASFLYIEDIDLCIPGFDNYGCTYFFIPSFVSLSYVSYDRSELKAYTDNGDLFDQPEFGSVQDVLVDTYEGGQVPYKIGFYKSNNLYTLYIDMHDKKIEDVGLNDYAEVSVKMISPRGNEEYAEDNAGIKARGNSTYGVEKKSYEIRLSNDVSFIDMTKSDKWVMLANAMDNTKICNKMVFDTAAVIGMEYVTEADWADVFIDGIYWGNYLLCHEPDIGKDDLDIGNLQKDNKPYYDPDRAFAENGNKGFDYDQNPADISGGYLVSVDPDKDRAKAGFYLYEDTFIRIKSPRNASREEVEYIKGFMMDKGEEIERLSYEEESNTTSIDYGSFSRRYLIDEAFANHDAQIGSYYFYKKRSENRLFAGPCWDYDLLYLQHYDPLFLSSGSVLDNDEAEIEWDKKLLKNTEYRNFIRKILMSYAGVFDRLITNGIDRYYGKIHDSLMMDNARWNNKEKTERLSSGHYELVESNIRYLKYALYKRMCFLADVWDIDYNFTEPEKSNGTIHKVTFNSNDGSSSVISIKDGGFIASEHIPKCDDGKHWVNEKAYWEPLWIGLPIYEDVIYIQIGDYVE